MENIRETPPSPLRLERVKQGIKPWRLANVLGISQSLYYAYEQGRRRCPANLRRKIADVLSTTPEALFPEGENQ